jgi:hypothetical protein
MTSRPVGRVDVTFSTLRFKGKPLEIFINTIVREPLLECCG